ncbi:unnamed protein product [Gongylonema pulchrum]|uniref:Uncharacterized protein n=1 Tax=Gongylonema pulchrum TaxID=637853 RepID=A0A3P7NHJ4_9BILA|nr:unnamed protein product [Gongylonema pulchrum]
MHPSVFIVVLDSTSSSSANRSMRRTNQAVLKHYYQSTTFQYHNKVGPNSRSNAFAMFSGSLSFITF